MHLIYGSGGSGPGDIGNKAHAPVKLDAAGPPPPFLVIPHRELRGWRGRAAAAKKRKVLAWARRGVARLMPEYDHFIVRSSFLGEDFCARSFVGEFSSYIKDGAPPLARAIDGVLAGAATGRRE